MIIKINNNIMITVYSINLTNNFIDLITTIEENSKLNLIIL